MSAQLKSVKITPSLKERFDSYKRSYSTSTDSDQTQESTLEYLLDLAEIIIGTKNAHLITNNMRLHNLLWEDKESKQYHSAKKYLNMTLLLQEKDLRKLCMQLGKEPLFQGTHTDPVSASTE